MRVFVTGVILAVTCSLSFSQKAYELSHQVLVPAANLVTSGGINYQQTIGETAVEITVPSIYVLTQGYQQPRFVPKVDLPDREGNGVDFFPNPVTEEDYHIFKIRLYGVLGRSYNIIITSLVGSLTYTANVELSPDHDYIHEVNMQNYANGIYIIRVLSADGVINRSFKIEKL
jgi:hypothetical protein